MRTATSTPSAPVMPVAWPVTKRIKPVKKRFPCILDEPKTIGHYLEPLKGHRVQSRQAETPERVFPRNLCITYKYFTIMFFQTINRMITAGTDLSINIRQVNDKLTVAVMPPACGTERRGRGTNRPAGIERYPGRAGHGIPGSDHRARTEGAGHPYQPGNIRETSGTGRITKQGGQVRS